MTAQDVQITIDPVSSLLRVDGLAICKVIITPNGPVLQFKDSDKLRSKYRGSEFIEVPLSVLEQTILSCTM